MRVVSFVQRLLLRVWYCSYITRHTSHITITHHNHTSLITHHTSHHAHDTTRLTRLQEQCQALQLQLDEQARAAGESEKALKEEVGCRAAASVCFVLCGVLSRWIGCQAAERARAG